MSIHIWCPRVSDSAVLLRDAVRAAGVQCHKSPANPSARQQEAFAGRFIETDLLLNWGNKWPYPAVGLRQLNNSRMLNKRSQLIELYRNNIPCPEVFDEPGDGRIGRALNHVGGSDLLHETGRDYWTQKLDIRTEMRIHVFRSKVIRAGVKIPRDGFCMYSNCRICRVPRGVWHAVEDDGDVSHGPHPWIRSYDAGWRISYNAQHNLITNVHRDLAKRAVTALALDFGAVDIGIVNNRRAAVLEVNLAPGLEGGSVDTYARHILAFHNER